MARFYGSMDGSAKTTATRCGTTNSGITAHVRGWDCGVEVTAVTCGNDDVIYIRSTGGSNDRELGTLIGRVKLVDGCPTFIAEGK